MSFRPINLRVNCGSQRSVVIIEGIPEFSWGIEGDSGDFFSEVELYGNGFSWKSKRKKNSFSVIYSGEKLPEGKKLSWKVTVFDENNNKYVSEEKNFFTERIKWQGKWITSMQMCKDRALYFSYKIMLKKQVKSVVVYYSGIGLCELYANNKICGSGILTPEFTNFYQRCAYNAFDLTDNLVIGENSLSFVVGGGWRTNVGKYLDITNHDIKFFGEPQLIADIIVEYNDITTEIFSTDSSWQCTFGPIVYNNLFMGSVYDAREKKNDLKKTFAVRSGSHIGKLYPQITEQITISLMQKPKKFIRMTDGILVDFGANMAGVLQIRIPSGAKRGEKINIKHSEITDETGHLFTDTLRTATAEDEYIFSGTEDGSEIFTPHFTYHGFRYAFLSGAVNNIYEEDVCAVRFYNNVDNESYFRCGSPIVNQIQDAIIRTERSNLHSIATDCPQRDERMGWLNDATVRFEAMPYNFDVGRLFPKILSDIVSEQSENGAIGSVAPLVYGSFPADPVCSSFLIAAYETYKHYGNIGIIEKYFNNMLAWDDFLESCSDNGIVNYGVYGDWAGPEDCCVAPENPHSSVTPEKFMSTGFHYYNCVLLEKMCEALGKTDIKRALTERRKRIGHAFNDRWVDMENISVGTNSQGCLAFALWLGILPEKMRSAAADKLNDQVISAGMRLTTGNLTSKYIFDVLADFGYIETAWKLIEKMDYPSLGFMLANGATTIWERFELKKSNNMNSHNHPMYGAVSHWFYTKIIGIRPIEPAWKRFSVKPIMPKNLNFAEACVDTVMGKIYVKWQRRYGKTELFIYVPFGTEACVEFGDKTSIAAPGLNIYSE